MWPVSQGELKGTITCLERFYKNADPRAWVHLRDGQNGMRLGIEAGKLLAIMKGEGLKKPLDPEELETHSVVTFIVKGQMIEADYELLASACPVFVTMLFGDFLEACRREVELNGIDPEYFRSLIEFIEGKKLIKPEDSKRIIGVYSLAELYQIEFVKENLPKHLAQQIEPGKLFHSKIVKLIKWNPNFFVETASALGLENAWEIAKELYDYIEDLKDNNSDGKNEALILTATKSLVDWINKAEVPLRYLTSIKTPELFFRFLDSSIRDLNYINFNNCPIPDEERSLLGKYEELDVLDDQKRSQLIEDLFRNWQ